MMEKAGVLKEYKNRDAHRSLELELVKDGRMKSTFDLLELNLENGKNPSIGHDNGEPDSFLLRSEIMKVPTSLLGYFVNGTLSQRIKFIHQDECHLIPIETDALVMDTIKEPMKERSRVPEVPESSTSSQTTPTVVSARLKVQDSGNLRGQLGGRRKPADNDPDLLFRTQQNMAPWRPVRYRRFMPSDAFESRIPLLYPYEDNELTCYGSNGPRQEDYISALLEPLAPVPTSHGRVEPTQPPSLEELIQTIMLKVHVIRFGKLVGCARERFSDPHQVTNAAVLQHVQKVAVLVRGWWVVKSELLYPPATYSEHATIPTSLLIRARDYIVSQPFFLIMGFSYSVTQLHSLTLLFRLQMAVFHRGEHLTRKTISSMTKLPALEATEILKLLARKMGTTQKGHVNHWEFHPVDQDFIRKYPDVVQQQHCLWEARIRQLCSQLKLERLVSDGARRKRRCSGRLSSESESETEVSIRSLVSGVHVSGGSGRQAGIARRKRQLSLSSTSASEDGNDWSAARHPTKKRPRTQSLSLAANNDSVSPLTGTTTALPQTTTTALSANPSASRLETLAVSNSFSFSVPLSPPPVSKFSSPSLLTTSTTTPVQNQQNPKANVIHPISCSVAQPTDVHSSVQPSLVTCKPEPTSPPAAANSSSRNVRFEMNSTELLTQNIKPEPSETNHSHSMSTEEIGSTAEKSADCERSTVSPILLNFVREKFRTLPIISLSELAKMVQQSLCGSPEDDQSSSFLYVREPGTPVPPPGSEAERELLKPLLTEALLQADARRLQVSWPTGREMRPEEPLFVARVAGSECGAISESTQKLRDALLDVCEKQPHFRMKDLMDRLEQLSIHGLARKTICSMLKHYCIYKHNRYYLRHTIMD
ncbi:DNA-directed RNA polymerase III subunit RPC5 [Paragonimus westermani]|uniref:DNA-directed RNA polymerase III subunit RPC5 n=1 Tax=Paragonimus westermani TaxID=34504 RepID=A0A5J4NAG8_9TREM|nr:DNA-directed RNA polymerase III subunit RPC5 [Paragonimus westermani]